MRVLIDLVRRTAKRRVFAAAIFSVLLLVCGASVFGAPGDLDTTFGVSGLANVGFNGGDDSARAVALQSDGKIIAGGYAKSGANYLFGLVRYNANGTLDTTFDTDGKVTTSIFGADDGITGLAIQTDGKIVAAGYALSGANYVFALARYNADGSLDTTFDTDGKATTSILGVDSFANAMRLQSNGKILLAGGAYNGTNYDAALARYNTDGSLDTTFDTDGIVTTPVLAGNDSANAVAIRSDGKIVAAGFAFSGAVSNFAILRYNGDGSLDNTFDTDGKLTTAILGVDDGVTGVALQTDNKIVAAGYAKSGANLHFGIARYNSDGSLDNTFSSDGKDTQSILGGSDAATAVAIQSNGKIVVTGGASNASDYDAAAFRWNPNGTPDTSFDTDGKATYNFGVETDNVGYASAIDSTGRIVIAGETGIQFMVIRIEGDAPVVPIRTLFDFDGDSKADLSIFRPAPGEWWWLNSSNGGNGAVQFGSSTDKIVPADFTGDGKTDITFWRPATGQWFVLRSEDFSYFAFPFGANGDVPVPADFDGDNKADAAVFRESTQTWFISRSTGGTDIVGFGSVGDKPVPMDYDGDGKADIAIFRPSGANGAEWWTRRSATGVVFAVQFGSATDKAVPGEYTGDGKADIAVYLPANGFWYVLRSEDLSYFAFPFGAAGDIPVPADYDGDGKTDPGVFRPSNGTWFANRSTGGTLIQQFGITGDVPLPSVYVR
ncbi:MAG: hypothetical protein IPG67_04435 [Acidobacteria bacterium]|nr:hypothetical protein [Acidobacteriota bacterium]